MSEQNALYCRNKARESDIDAYLAALFAPSSARDAQWTLTALAGEVARAPAHAAEPMLAQIRLQWWREAVGRLYDGHADAHPVLTALGALSGVLPRAGFEQFFEARQAALEAEVPRFEQTRAAHSALLKLKDAALFPDAAGLSPSTLRPLAEALAVGEELRRLSGADTAKARDLVQRGQAAIREAGQAFGADSRQPGLALILPLAPLRRVLGRLQRANFVPGGRVLDPPVYQRQLAMLRAFIWGL